MTASKIVTQDGKQKRKGGRGERKKRGKEGTGKALRFVGNCTHERGQV